MKKIKKFHWIFLKKSIKKFKSMVAQNFKISKFILIMKQPKFQILMEIYLIQKVKNMVDILMNNCD